MSNGKQVLWTPDGVKTIGAAAPDRVELRSGLMEWFRQFNDFAARYKIGLHCSLCGADLVGKNADSDRVFSSTCGCREFVGANREYRDVPVH